LKLIAFGHKYYFIADLIDNKNVVVNVAFFIELNRTTFDASLAVNVSTTQN
jgi:hypothetical protein